MRYIGEHDFLITVWIDVSCEQKVYSAGRQVAENRATDLFREIDLVRDCIEALEVFEEKSTEQKGRSICVVLLDEVDRATAEVALRTSERGNRGVLSLEEYKCNIGRSFLRLPRVYRSLKD